MNIDLVQYLTKAHVSVLLVEIIKIPTQREKVKKFLGFDQVDDPPVEDAPVCYKR
jgi:hypothetical protein